jgi:hypothetical protein
VTAILCDQQLDTTEGIWLTGAVEDRYAPGLTPLLSSLLDSVSAPDLPDWSYRTWWRVLHYPDLDDRAQTATKDLGRCRDAALAYPSISGLVEWAGRRRRREPVAGAAAALVTVREAQVQAVQNSGSGAAVDVSALARRLVAAVDTARPVRVMAPRRDHFIADPERLVDIPSDQPEPEDPRLPGIVGRYLRLAGVDSDGQLAFRVQGAVVQAGDWWANHAVGVPSSLGGHELPGVVPAQRLRTSARLSAAVSDLTLLGLVAGPRPGRGRPAQVCWRRGLTYWVAVGLLVDCTAPRPPTDTVRWWRIQLESAAQASPEPLVLSSGHIAETA